MDSFIMENPMKIDDFIMVQHLFLETPIFCCGFSPLTKSNWQVADERIVLDQRKSRQVEVGLKTNQFQPSSMIFC